MINKKLTKVIDILDKRLAEDLTVIDFEGKSSIADMFLLCTAKNDRHADSLVTYLKEDLEGIYDIYHIDDADLSWVIVDLGDIIVHIFSNEMRQKYQLERLWSDQKIVKL